MPNKYILVSGKNSQMSPNAGGRVRSHVRIRGSKFTYQLTTYHDTLKPDLTDWQRYTKIVTQDSTTKQKEEK